MHQSMMHSLSNHFQEQAYRAPWPCEDASQLFAHACPAPPASAECQSAQSGRIHVHPKASTTQIQAQNTHTHNPFTMHHVQRVIN